MRKQRRSKLIAMPKVLTGAPGEVLSVSSWPLLERQIRRLKASDAGMTDCIIHFDRINVRSVHGSRRVRYDSDGFYVTVWDRGTGGVRRVRIKGALMFECFDAISTVYYPVTHEDGKTGIKDSWRDV